jgi:hypothetical protein
VRVGEAGRDRGGMLTGWVAGDSSRCKHEATYFSRQAVHKLQGFLVKIYILMVIVLTVANTTANGSQASYH